MEDIIKIIIASFSSLWKVKKYGKTIEIITPFFTTNDCFVSVFLTEREGYYIITDGGWISENYYNNFFDSDDESYLRLFTYYKEQYSIRETESNNKIYYYKTTTKIKFSSTSYIIKQCKSITSFNNSIKFYILIPLINKPIKRQFLLIKPSCKKVTHLRTESLLQILILIILKFYKRRTYHG